MIVVGCVVFITIVQLSLKCQQVWPCLQVNRLLPHSMLGIQVRVVRIFNTYGPRMALDDGRVVSNFVAQALTNQDLTVYGNGKQTRSFQYVSDLIQGQTLHHLLYICISCAGCSMTSSSAVQGNVCMPDNGADAASGDVRAPLVLQSGLAIPSRAPAFLCHR